VQVSAESTNREKRDLYNRVMDDFKKRLVNEQDDTARQARALFEKDGFTFSVDRDQRMESKLPMLKDAQLRGVDMGRHSDLFRVSGQHLDKIEDGGDPVAAGNLVFQIARDNMQMDVKGTLSEYVRERVVARLKEQGLDVDKDE
jgi:hypothetical protein